MNVRGGEEPGGETEQNRAPKIEITISHGGADDRNMVSDPDRKSPPNIEISSRPENYQHARAGHSPRHNCLLVSGIGNKQGLFASSGQTPNNLNKRDGSSLDITCRPSKRFQIQSSPELVQSLLPLPQNTVFQETSEVSIHCEDSLRSTSHSTNRAAREQNASPAVQIPGLYLAQNTQKVALETELSQNRTGNGQHGFPSKTKKSGPPQLGPAIWAEESRIQTQFSTRRDPSIPRISHRISRNATPPPECPFWDGGIPGEGGDSSDEEILMHPIVIGREVHMGGWRNHEALPVNEEAQDLGRFRQLSKMTTVDDMLRSQVLRSRRQYKLAARALAKQWQEAQARSDSAKMERVEFEAKGLRFRTSMIPLFGEMEQLDCESPAPNSRQYVTPSPRCQVPRQSPQASSFKAQINFPGPSSHTSIGYLEVGIQSRKRSRSLHSCIRENNETKAEAGYTSTSRPKNFRNQIRFLSAGKSSYEPASKNPNYTHNDDTDDEDDEDADGCAKANDADSGHADDEEYPTPIEQRFRKQQTSQAAIVKCSPYRASNVLSKATTYEDRYNSKNTRNAPTQQQKPNSKFGGFQTTPPKPLRRVPAPDQTIEKSLASVDLISPVKASPVAVLSAPMKDRISPPSKNSFKKSTKIRSRTPSKLVMIAEEPASPGSVHQQMCADRIIAAEFQAARERIDEELFGEVTELTLEEKARQEAVKQEQAKKKHEAKEKEQLALGEAARLAEAQKQKEFDEAREKDRLKEEREIQSKKAKWEVERKRQLALDAENRHEKRRNIQEVIVAHRAQEAAKAEAQEKKREKEMAMKMNQLKIELMKKDLEVKRLQAFSLIRPKACKADKPNNSTSKVKPSPVPEDDPDSLFISETQSNDRASISVNDLKCQISKAELFAQVEVKAFGEERAEGKAVFEDRRKAENIKRRMLTRISSTTPKSSPNTSEHITKKPKITHSAPRSKMTFENLQNTLNSFAQPPHNRNPTELVPVKTNKSENVSNRSAQAAIPRLPPSPPKKIWSSEARLIEDIELETLKNERETRQQEKKRNKNEQRRRNDSDKIANKHRRKLLHEAMEGGFIIGEDDLKKRVDEYMKLREVKYQKQQAKKRSESSSFDSIAEPQPVAQSFILNRSFTELQSSSISAATSGTEYDKSQPDIQGIQLQKRTHTDLNSWLAATKREKGGRFAEPAAKSSVNQFQQGSEESEEDPDPTLEAMLASKRGKIATVNDIGGGSQAGELAASEHGKQLEIDLNNVFTKIFDSNQESSPNLHSTTNSSIFKVAEARSKCPSQGESEMIQVYRVEKTETKDGKEGDAEVVKMFTDRQQANEMGSDLIQEYITKALVKPPSSWQIETKENFYSGKFVLDTANSITVRVTSTASHTSRFAGLDVSKIQKHHGEKVWVIKRELKKSATDAEDRLVMTHLKEDATDQVYTDRELANNQAANNFIAFLKPVVGNIEHEEEWTRWQNIIRDSLKDIDEGGKCWEVGVVKEDGDLEWMEWDEVDYKVEEKKIFGPKN